MGLLSNGTPLHWNDAKKHADHVRAHGIQQFLTIFHNLKNQKDQLLWGDEIEYMVVAFDDENKNAKLSLRVFEVLDALYKEQREAETHLGTNDEILQTAWHPEYGRFMLEATPGAPYGSTLRDLLNVEPNMRLRRVLAQKYLKPNEIPLTITSYPRLGASGQFLEPHHEPNGDAARSMFVPDEIINPHARFPTLTANIRRRRGAKVAINVPIFHDVNTPRPFIDPTIPWDRNLFPEDSEARAGAALPDHIYLDAMAFGMGCCCLQITFQACNIEEARRLYDQLATLGPIMVGVVEGWRMNVKGGCCGCWMEKLCLALTAAAPIYRGYLADVDCRWNVIAGSVDDRTEEERGLKPLKNNRYVISKSRYDSIDSYLSTDATFRPEYNDIPLVFDNDIRQTLVDNGVDNQLARHVAHLFIRDPLVIFEESLDQDDMISSDHFENIQSTNWQTMRFKPPPPGSSIGWRVEFRSMEVQMTDFENAAFATFIVLLTRVILSFGLNFYVPISKVDENMKKAHKRGAAINEKFYFRKNVFPSQTAAEGATSDTSNGAAKSGKVEDEYDLFTINEIINGNGTTFRGLIPLIESYLNSLNVDIETRCDLSKYLELVRKRADGTLVTGATWMRNFVQNHPYYRQDSVVSQEINYDLVREIARIGRGEVIVPELLGNFNVAKK
ncbi:glutamate-cysteine ligase-domain-containing protein [Jimgerdemannia flammicorona]|uniref:Glutamate-cysteine ligase-domain-containing protein n=2 Tax=Jimgerdemannia flammicorona TaxID=994334 RepID=A0A433CY94_9FUNG|nr:glutamate-cysteine ligase-domain-containing protein [Jimgerdemannia flammicorona]RUS31862.1 glutamate-cysteine ligase-domain-containing protein [Jimgerdemannia flammicorona]